MERNQKVSIENFIGGGCEITALQGRSTPGGYRRFILKRSTKYLVRLVGWGGGQVRLWIGDYDRETLYYSNESLGATRTVIEHLFDTAGRSHFHIGALFNAPRVGVKVIVESLTVEEMGMGSQGPCERIREDPRLANKIEEVYDRYWSQILDLIDSPENVASWWNRVRDFEFRRNRKEFIYLDRTWQEFKGDWDLYERAFEASRDPLIRMAPQMDWVMEIGAGWGKNLVYLRERTGCEGIGLELTQGGLDVMTHLGLDGRRFDLNTPEYPRIPGGSLLVFSMWSLKEVTNLKKMVFYKLLECGAETIVGLHVEPVGWQITGGTQILHFNKNLISLLRELEAEGRIRLLTLKPDQYGFFSEKNIGTLIIWESVPGASKGTELFPESQNGIEK